MKKLKKKKREREKKTHTHTKTNFLFILFFLVSNTEFTEFSALYALIPHLTPIYTQNTYFLSPLMKDIKNLKCFSWASRG